MEAQADASARARRRRRRTRGLLHSHDVQFPGARPRACIGSAGNRPGRSRGEARRAEPVARGRAAEAGMEGQVGLDLLGPSPSAGRSPRGAARPRSGCAHSSSTTSFASRATVRSFHRAGPRPAVSLASSGVATASGMASRISGPARAGRRPAAPGRLRASAPAWPAAPGRSASPPPAPGAGAAPTSPPPPRRPGRARLAGGRPRRTPAAPVAQGRPPLDRLEVARPLAEAHSASPRGSASARGRGTPGRPHRPAPPPGAGAPRGAPPLARPSPCSCSGREARRRRPHRLPLTQDKKRIPRAGAIPAISDRRGPRG